MSRSYSYRYKPVSLTRPKRIIVGVVLASSLLIALLLAVTRPHTALAPLAVISQVRGAAKQEDILTEHDWSHFAGAKYDGLGVHITALNRAIVNQDGSGGQPNPPVNIRGPHLAVKGDFRITAEVSGIESKWADLQFYGGVPIIYDEWRLEPPSVRLRLSEDAITITIWDGKKASPKKEKRITDKFGSDFNVTLERHGKVLRVLVNKQQITSLQYYGVFDKEQVWFGADAEVGHTGWTLRTLEAEALAGGKVEVVAAPKLTITSTGQDTLRNLSQATVRKLPIGAALSLYPLLSDHAYHELAAGQFSMLTPENEMKAQFIHPQKDVYAFADADSLVDFAKVNKMQVHGHGLVFGEANPRWMTTTPKAERKQVMIDHIKTIVGRYKGRVTSWDVVNEPLADNDESDETSSDIRNHIWYQAMGEEYIALAFKTARAADPLAKLYMNDWGVEEDNDRWDALLGLLTRLKAKGVPIDGFGFQGHVYEEADAIDPKVLSRHIRQLATLGIEARVSELDVTGVDSAWQAKQYAEVLETCIAEPNCKSFSMWGVSDAYGSTTELHSYPPEPGDNLLWDSDFQDKPAYRLAIAILKNF